MARTAQWDKEIVSLIARVKFLRAEHVAKRFGMSYRNANFRLRSLSDAGLLWVDKRFPGGWLYAATREGIEFADLDLSPARFSYASIEHDLDIAEFVVACEAAKYPCLAEREIVAYKRAFGGNRYAFNYWMNGRSIAHVPDAAFEAPDWGLYVAVEFERSDKSVDRCKAILRCYSHRIDRDGLYGVLFLTSGRCSPDRIRNLVARQGLEQSVLVCANPEGIPADALREVFRMGAQRQAARRPTREGFGLAHG